MGNELKIFTNEEFGQIRTVLIENEPWFVGKDVATALGYADTKQAIRTNVHEDDKKHLSKSDFGGCTSTTPEINNFGATVINESGVYALIFGSKLEKAKKFKHWVTSEVLPSIRKHGAYMTDNTLERVLDDPDFLIQLATKLKEEKAKNKVLSEENEAMKPKALFADSVQASQTSILVGDLAKLLKQNGYDIGANRLFGWLRENDYLIKRNGTDHNMPTQRSMKLGLFEIKERTLVNSDGSVRITKTPKVTGKGQIYFINKFLDMKED